MPYKFADLKGSGKDLLVTNRANIVQQVTGFPNTQGGIVASATSISSPGLYYPDTTGFFAPSWGSGSEAISFVIPFILQATAIDHYLFYWSDPTVALGLYCYISSTEAFYFGAHNTISGAYLNSATGVLSAGTYLAHLEMLTGSSRTINIYLNNSLVTQTRAGPTGTPYVPTGTERLHVISANNGTSADVSQTVGGLWFKRGIYTAAERAAHLQALNIA